MNCYLGQQYYLLNCNNFYPIAKHIKWLNVKKSSNLIKKKLNHKKYKFLHEMHVAMHRCSFTYENKLSFYTNWCMTSRSSDFEMHVVVIYVMVSNVIKCFYEQWRAINFTINIKTLQTAVIYYRIYLPTEAIVRILG